MTSGFFRLPGPLWTCLVISTCCCGPTAFGQLTIGDLVERNRKSFGISLNRFQFRLKRATEDLIETSELDDENKRELRTKTAEFAQLKRQMVKSLIDEAKTKFDQSKPGKGPLGGPFKDLSDLRRSLTDLHGWLKHVSSVLTEAQAASYKKILKDRDAFHLNAKVSQWVVEIDNRVYLSDRQRVDLLRTLSEWYSSVINAPNSPHSLGSYSRPTPPLEVLSKVLDEKQIEEWNNRR